MPVVVWFLVG